MLITTEKLLTINGACSSQINLFTKTFPCESIEPTVENMVMAKAQGLDVLWLCNLLPTEGPGSARDYIMWCIKQTVHLKKKYIGTCLTVVRRYLQAGDFVAVARAVTWAVAEAAAWTAFETNRDGAVWDEAWDTARAVAKTAQLVYLSQLLMKAK